MSGYELLGEIARGGMARVLLCRRVGAAGFERYLAMKVIHDHLADDEEFVSMLLDEASVASRISHPHVVSVQDVGRTAQGAYYLIMEYVEGASLHRLLKLAGDDAPLGVVVALLVDALEGLHAAHRACDDEGQLLGIVHRDVSPQNVLVGLDGVARIVDFGIAKASSRITSTRPGMLKGRVRYMAPEQLLRGEATERSDVYSAAVVAFGALSGEPLVPPSADAAAMYRVLSLEAPPVSTRGRRPPEAFDAPLARALRKDPSERTATAAQLATELREAAEAGGLSLERGEVVAWVERWIGEEVRERRRKIRARKAVSLGSHSGSMSLPSGSVSLVDASEPTSSSQTGDALDTTPTTRRHRLVLVAALGALGAALWTRVLVGSHDTRDPEPSNAARLDPHSRHEASATPTVAREERTSERAADDASSPARERVALPEDLARFVSESSPHLHGFHPCDWAGCSVVGGGANPALPVGGGGAPPPRKGTGAGISATDARSETIELPRRGTPPEHSVSSGLPPPGSGLASPHARPMRPLASPHARPLRGAPPPTSPPATTPAWDVERLPLDDTSLPLRGGFDEASTEGER
jgi:serine/threonine-protein kinase